MRISDERYTKDRRALDVAAMLVEFEARTGTIRRLTGLTDDRIRKLSRACGAGGHSETHRRHRGRSPQRVTHILGKTRSRSEASTLLGLCRLMGVTPSMATATERGPDRVLRAERLCDAYWTFRSLLPEATLSFEHLLLLLSEVEKSEEMTSTYCRSCNAVLVVDMLSLHASRCPHCAEHAPYTRSEPAQYACVAEESAVYS